MKKKVLLKAPILTQSGYGEHSRFIFRVLKQQEELFDIYVEPLEWGKTGWIWEDSEERIQIDHCIGKFYQLVQQKAQNTFDICVNVDLPTAWKRVAPVMIGVTAGIEADAVSPAWLGPSFSEVDKILVPSFFSKQGFLNSIDKYKNLFDQSSKNNLSRLRNQLEDKISVVSYPVKDYKIVDLNLSFETNFNFLLVAQWGPRKNIVKTVSQFYSQFKNNPDVGLVIKTNLTRNSKPDSVFVVNKLKKIKEDFKDSKCKVYLLHGELTNDEIHSLYNHPKIKAMINFGHGEGFGLPLFEAAYCGLPIISHDFGGQKDFLYAPKNDKKRPHFSKIHYKMGKISQDSVWSGVLEEDAEWAFPDMPSCGLAMAEALKKPEVLKSEAKRLQAWVRETFEERKVMKQALKSCFENFLTFEETTDEDLDKWIEDFSK